MRFPILPDTGPEAADNSSLTYDTATKRWVPGPVVDPAAVAAMDTVLSDFQAGQDATDTGVASAAATGPQTRAALGTDYAPRLPARFQSTYSEEPQAACVSFVDDDGLAEVHSRLLPVLSAQGVAGASAVITGMIGQPGYMTWSQVDALVAAGWELLGHGENYTANLSEFDGDDDALDHQLGAGCRSVLLRHSEHVHGFVYPQSVSDVRIRRFTRRHYDYAFAGYGINSEPIDPLQINRIAFGSWTTSNPTVGGNSEKNTLAYYKACVDAAVAAGGWVVFMLHVGQQDVAQDAVLADLIDYVQSLSVPIVTPAQGYARHGHRVFAGDVASGDWVAISERGIFGSNPLPRIIEQNSKPAADGIVTFHTGTTQQAVNFTTASNWNLPPGSGGTRAGVLVTYRAPEGILWSRQEYRLHDGRLFVRVPTSDTAWGAWGEYQRVDQASHVVVPMNTYTAAQLITAYPSGKVTVCANNGAGGAGFPGSGAGMTTTYRINGNGWDRQEWRKYDSDEVWARHVNASDGAWSAWVKISAA